MAAECLRLLDLRIADPDAATQRIAISPTLVIRESTGGHS
jgi:DNA-binding LacI/PurR family transcriptional regulator